MTPTVQSASRTDSGLASELRLSVMRLSRRLRSEREPVDLDRVRAELQRVGLNGLRLADALPWPMTPAGIRAAQERYFPFLTETGERVAGLTAVMVE